jgi:hypothetical protein
MEYVPRVVDDPELRYIGPNGIPVARIAAHGVLVPALNLRPALQITKASMASDDPP